MVEDALAQEVGYLLKRAQHALRTTMDAALAEIGLTTPQYAALLALEQLDTASNAELARACFVTPQTMHIMLRGLERDGLVERSPHPTHGRIVRTALTPAGHTRLADARPRAAAIDQQMLAGLSPPQVDAFRAAIERAIINLGG
jgi:DNA-binding MarR family transcriptional regulator